MQLGVSNMAVNTVIEAFVARYLAEHPGYRLPSGDTHPVFLALSSPIKHWIADQLGIARFWRHMLRSAMIWFPSRDTDPRAFRYFCISFEAAGNIGGSGHAEYDNVAAEYAQWRSALGPRNPSMR